MAFVQSEPRRANRENFWDRFEYRFIWSVVFAFSMVATPVKRALGKNSSEAGQSIVAEAKSMAHTAAGYAFQR